MTEKKILGIDEKQIDKIALMLDRDMNHLKLQWIRNDGENYDFFKPSFAIIKQHLLTIIRNMQSNSENFTRSDNIIVVRTISGFDIIPIVHDILQQYRK